jgi:protease I
MELTGKKIAIFVDNFYQDQEVWYPYLRLKEAGARVSIIGAKKGATYTSKFGCPITAEMSYTEAKTGDFDGLIVPGGYAPDLIRRHPEAVKFVRDIDAEGKFLGTICHGGWVLCSAGVMRGRRVTSFFAIRDDVVNAGGLWEDAAVVVDRNLVTSRTPDDLPVFCVKCLEVIGAGALAASARHS